MNEFLKRFGSLRKAEIEKVYAFEPDAKVILQDKYGYSLYFYTTESAIEFLNKHQEETYLIERPCE
jgi:hypothetical protein